MKKEFETWKEEQYVNGARQIDLAEVHNRRERLKRQARYVNRLIDVFGATTDRAWRFPPDKKLPVDELDYEITEYRVLKLDRT